MEELRKEEINAAIERMPKSNTSKPMKGKLYQGLEGVQIKREVEKEETNPDVTCPKCGNTLNLPDKMIKRGARLLRCPCGWLRED
jgi:predicted RNA-binding Zn-ribbon protein involved in translation (DUF1610 family)